MTATPAGGPGVLARWEPVIGIEVHCQLKTASKMFCGCSNTYADAPPNTHTCPVCLGLPGTLPVINRKAVEHVLATGVAIGAETPAATRLPQAATDLEYLRSLTARTHSGQQSSDLVPHAPEASRSAAAEPQRAPLPVTSGRCLRDPARALDHFYAALGNTEARKSGAVTRITPRPHQPGRSKSPSVA